MTISELTLAHYDALISLWSRTPGICIRDADSREATSRYLIRNPGLSFVAEENGEVIACAMSGHDGRRGYIQHVVVAEAYRGRGIAAALLTRCLDGLAAHGIQKSHIEVLATNDVANRYWSRGGWQRRDDLVRYSFTRPGHENA